MKHSIYKVTTVHNETAFIIGETKDEVENEACQMFPCSTIFKIRKQWFVTPQLVKAIVDLLSIRGK